MFGSGVGWYTDAVTGQQSLPYCTSFPAASPRIPLSINPERRLHSRRLVLIGVGMAAASVPPGRRLPPRQLSQGTSVPSPRPLAPPRFSRTLSRRATLTGVRISFSSPKFPLATTDSGGWAPPTLRNSSPSLRLRTAASMATSVPRSARPSVGPPPVGSSHVTRMVLPGPSILIHALSFLSWT